MEDLAKGGPTESRPADPDAVRDFWLSTVRPAADGGRLDKIKPIPAVTPKLRDVARTQNHWLTRKTFGSFGPNYDRIHWKSRREEQVPHD